MAGPAYYTATVNIAKNDDWVVAFEYLTPNPDGTPGPPIDLSGSTLKLEMRAHESDNEAALWVDSNPGNGIWITNPTAGQFTIVLDRADHLARLAVGTYVIDLVRLMADNFQERLFEGTATVVEGTTR
jgi:hypothetical protein